MSGDVFYLAPGLSGRIAHLKKLIKRLQKQRDAKVNKNVDVLAAKTAWDLCRTDRISKDDGSRSKRKKLFEIEQEAKASYDEILEEHRKSHRLTPIMEQYWRDIRHEVEKAHQVTTYFESCFPVVVSPPFGSDQKMFAKKSAGGLPGWWKSKIQLMAHGRRRKLLLRRVSRKGGVMLKVSESCSTMMCGRCMTLHSPGMYFDFNLGLGKSKIHHCPGCGESTHRDESGRSIGLMMMVRMMGIGGQENENGASLQTIPLQVNADAPLRVDAQGFGWLPIGGPTFKRE